MMKVMSCSPTAHADAGHRAPEEERGAEIKVGQRGVTLPTVALGSQQQKRAAIKAAAQ